MGTWLLRRLLLVIPTLWAIITINFFIVQTAPGGPVDQAITAIELGYDNAFSHRHSGKYSEGLGGVKLSANIPGGSHYTGSRDLDPETIAEITQRFGFDQPLHRRYLDMLWHYLCFDFGDSLFRGESVITLIKSRLPVSLSLSLWSIMIIYLISIPLGIKKATKHGTAFDIGSSICIIIAYAIPAFLFAIVLVILFAGGSGFAWFPVQGLVSSNFDTLSWYSKVIDYLWHMVLPVLATIMGGFATLTLLTKSAFLDEIRKQYVITARAKGLTESKILWRHVFRNAMLLVISGFPATFTGLFFTGSLLIEVVFSLNGLGLLGFDATLQRDYPVMFGTLYIFTLITLLLNIFSDITCTLIDPRITFERLG